MEIRDAVREDVDAITTIYNQGIEDRVATLETRLRSAEEQGEWLAAHGERYPVLVALDTTGQVVGWGSLNQFNPRPPYQHVVDFSIYVARDHRGQSIGDRLLKALEARARSLGYHKMVLAAFTTNERSRRLNERNNFRLVGVYREQGLLDGQWVDVTVMEKIL
jgi:phosphinothricin acetyltransferase